MEYVKTTLATEPCQPVGKSAAFMQRLVLALLWFIPRGNPDFEALYDDVRCWYLETEQDFPVREVGLDEHGIPVVAGPIGRNLGFWTDEDMTFPSKDYEAISREEFEAAWSEFLAKWQRKRRRGAPE